MRILILGGTSEASDLARRLEGDARFDAMHSLAGRTSSAAAQPIATRVGGFGGADGLERWLAEQEIEAIVDATHPFAAQISANAKAASSRLGLPLCTILRPPWQPEAGDRWTVVRDGEAAAAALGSTPRRIFLSIGRQGVGAFAKAPQHTYLIRSIERPDANALPPRVEMITARGPFGVSAETELLVTAKIDLVVSKNSGGEATYAKIAAARALALPVVMIARPEKAHGTLVTSAEAAHGWIVRHHDAAPRSERAV